MRVRFVPGALIYTELQRVDTSEFSSKAHTGERLRRAHTYVQHKIGCGGKESGGTLDGKSFCDDARLLALVDGERTYRRAGAGIAAGVKNLPA